MKKTMLQYRPLGSLENPGGCLQPKMRRDVTLCRTGHLLAAFGPHQD